MAMTSVTSLISSSVAIVVVFLLSLPSSAHCLNHKPSTDNFRGLVVADKMRLGSMPPSCHNKCNQCHPCLAVQVPTLPSRNGVQPSSTGQVKPLEYFDSSPSSAGNRYSNYKPLGWKCRCGSHFYNP